MSVGKARLTDAIILLIHFSSLWCFAKYLPAKGSIFKRLLYYDTKGLSLSVSFVLMPEAINCHDSTKVTRLKRLPVYKRELEL